MDRQDAALTWRRLALDDFPLLAQWLEVPSVARWWNHETSAAAIERDFGPAVRGEEPSEDLLVSLDGRPLGLVQRSVISDYPDYLAELQSLTDVPSRAITIDYFIGVADKQGIGLGTRMLRAAVARAWIEHPDAPAIIVAVVAANVASWRALEKAGLVRVAEGDMEPDNPVDEPLHYVYRVDRPQPARPAPDPER
jgi:aminoglycoside 6'-N-acetyltransferase